MFPRPLMSDQFGMPAGMMPRMPAHNIPNNPGFTHPGQQAQFPTQMTYGPAYNVGFQTHRGQRPPMYTPQMAQTFHSRQRNTSGSSDRPPMSPEEAQERNRQQYRLKEYQSQKMKLQSFATTGTMKVDADKLIEGMFGKKEQNRVHKKVATGPVASADDSFGEFLGGTPPPTPSVPVSTIAATDNSEVSNHVGEPPKDLASMMFECSDLSVPSKAKTFHNKPTLKEVHRKNSDKSISFNQSNTARDWSNAGSNLEGLFLLAEPPKPMPQTTAPHPKTGPPPWLTSPDQLPPVYHYVMEACIIDGVVSTERLYPILLLSGLSRDILGQLWMMVNKTSPGQLTTDELVKALAIVALVQNKIQVTSLDILHRCPTAPVPVFSNPNTAVTASTVPGAAQNTPQQASAHAPQQAPAHAPQHVPVPQQPPQPQQSALPNPQINYANNLPTGPANIAVSNQPISTSDDFANFQTAKPSKHKQNIPPSNNASTKHSTKTTTAFQIRSKPLPYDYQSDSNHIPAEERHSNVSTFFCSDDSSTHSNNLAPNLKHKVSSEDDFDDFKSAGSGHVSSELSENEDFKALDSYITNLSNGNTPNSPKNKAQFQPKRTNIPSVKNQPTAKNSTNSTVKFGDFSSFKPNTGTRINPQSIGTKQTAGKISNISFNPQNISLQATGNFTLPNTSTSNPIKKFGDDLIGDESMIDKYSALKGIDDIQLGSSLFNTVPPSVVNQAITQNVSPLVEEDDWADFQTSRVNNENVGPKPFTFTHSHTVPDNLHAAHETDKKNDILKLFNQSTDSKILNEPLKKSQSFAGNENWAAFGGENDHNLFKTDISNMDDDNTWSDFTGVNSGFNAKDNDINKPYQETEFSVHKSGEPTSNFIQANSTKAAVKPPLASMNVILQANPIVTTENRKDSAESNNATKYAKQISSDYGEDYDFSKGMPPPIDDQSHHDEYDDFNYDDREPVSPEHTNTHFKTSTDKTYPSPYHHTASFSAVPPIHADEPPDLSPSSKKPIGFEIDIDTEKSDDYYMNIGLQNSASSQELSQSFKSLNNADAQSINSLDLPVDITNKNIAIVPDSKSLDSLDLKLETHDASTPDTKSLDSLETHSDGGDVKRRSSVENGDNLEQSTVLDSKIESGLKPTCAVMSSGPMLGDRYAAISADLPGNDLYTHEWERCLSSCYNVISEANNIFNGVSSSIVCNEVIKSVRGMDYVSGLLEIYRVSCRIVVAMDTIATHTTKLNGLKKDIDVLWNNLTVFIVNCPAISGQLHIDYQTSLLKSDDPVSQMKACGLCLLDVDIKSKKDNSASKLMYGGRQYHVGCANFWVNRVDSTLPILRLPDLL